MLAQHRERDGEAGTRQLADLGARVIKIERPGVGDFARAYDARVKGQSSHFVWTNRSKESLALDLKQPVAPQQFALPPVAPYRHRLVLDLFPLVAPDPLWALVKAQ